MLLLVLVGVAAPAGCSSGGGSPTDGKSGLIGGGRVPFDVVAVLSQTGAGMSREAGTSDVALAVGNSAGLDRLLAGVGKDLAARVRTAASHAHVGPTDALIGQTIGYGCHRNTVLGVFQKVDGLVITGSSTQDANEECYAPVTTIALVTVDADRI